VPRHVNEITWRIGGPQGSGIDRLANIFGRVCASYGLNIFGQREYHSNIMGRHSYFDYCISPEPIFSRHDATAILVTFDAETLCRHLLTVADGGHVLYAAELDIVAPDSLPFLEPRYKQNLAEALTREGRTFNLKGLLEQACQRGVQTIAIPYTEILRCIADQCQLPRRQAGRVINTLAVSASAALLGFPDSSLIVELENVFGNDRGLLDLNLLAVAKAYEFIAIHYGPSTGWPWLCQTREHPDSLIVNGSQSVALGKLAAGLAFQTYYPISPASDESIYLEAQKPVPLRTGSYAAPVVLQVEDELAAATMACGAALTGARSATSTSGPGFSLMAESLGWAGMNEVPLVVSLYQRGGPSTGMPTRMEQGDLQFAIHAGHGEFPRMVLASGDVEDCFYDTMDAFNYAERYQLPVIHLLDKALASTIQTLPQFRYQNRVIDRGELFSSNDPAKTPVARFSLTPSGISPRPLLGQDNAQHWLTGAEHDSYGQVSEDPAIREQMMEKRMHKLEKILEDLPCEEKLRVYGSENSQFTLLTWGSATGAVRDAARRMAQFEIDIRVIQLRLVWPFPTGDLAVLLADAAPLVVVECNYSGQVNALLHEHLGHGADHLLVKYNGRPISGDAVFAALQDIHAGNGKPRYVLHNPNE